MSDSPTKVTKEDVGLGSLYDTLKNQSSGTNPTPSYTIPLKGDNARVELIKQRECLKNRCGKHLLLDVYCKILPLDKDYIDGHMGQMGNDIDSMIQSKGMTPVQYLKSCYESTKAPLLEFVIRSIDTIGQLWMESAEDEVKSNQERGIDAPIPEAPEDPSTDEDINNQLVDVENDIDYETFVDKLKDKTIKKIVADISKIITDKKEDSEMVFKPKPIADLKEETESTTSIGMDYLQSHLIEENIDTSELTEAMLGMAIRESTLNQFDVAFNQPSSTFKEFASRIRYNQGMIINESAIREFVESSKSSEEVEKVVDGARKEMNDKINSKLKATDIIDSDVKDAKTDDDKSKIDKTRAQIK